MKKYIIIGLIVLIGIVYLLVPLFRQGPGPIDPIDDTMPAVFTFSDNLATVGSERVNIEIEVVEDVEKLELFYNDSVIKTWNNPKGILKYDLNAGELGVGTRTLNLLSTLKDGSTFVDNRMVRVLSDIEPELLSVSIVKDYPHNATSFTQGLEFYNGRLFEGTGDPGDQGKSIVAEVKLESGEHLSTMGLGVGFFGEGITILDKTLYQLTWKNQKCYTYNIDNSLQLMGEYSYTGEGWGICNDGSQLIMSNGTERIVFRDPKTFGIVRTIEVYNNKGPVTQLNELEYIDGKIFANVWTTNMLVVIDPDTGKVLQEIDATILISEGRGNGEVMNGIAFDNSTRKIYMTGKNWNKLFEVRFGVPGM